MEADFSGYATKAGLKCSDGRTIMPEAFQHMDGMQVPLVWQHGHSNSENILGHAVLEARKDGVYAYGYFNDTPQGLNSKKLVQHKDVRALSIYANELVERSKSVFHGMICEVSLVLKGANPGAFIDNVTIAHGDGLETKLEDEVIISTGLELEHESPKSEEDLEHAEKDGDDDGETVQDVYDSMSDKQKQVVHYMIGAALESNGDSAKQSGIDDSEADDNNNKGDLAHKEGSDMNVFDQNGDKPGATGATRKTLTHSQVRTIMEDAEKMGSLRSSVLSHAVEYGIEDIELLFPDAKAITNTPELIARRQEWVSEFLGGTRKVPFSRIKSLSADITHDEARAKGYVKATMKKDEWFGLEKRETTPQTVYKKQKLDRDDIIDITDLDVVAWLKGEMRLMLDEEIARAGLVGDGREVDDPDKIREDRIRPIAYDDDFYTHKVVVPANTTPDSMVEAILRARPKYRGSGNPTMFCTEDVLTDLLLSKDKMNRRQYDTQAALETALRVRKIVTVDVMEGHTVNGGELLAVIVNLQDYTMGATRGGEVNMFDDFDIDFNQHKYLIETRLSAALTKFKSAIAVSRASGGTSATPVAPTFNPATGVVTIPATTGVEYRDGDSGEVLTAGAQSALLEGETMEVEAFATSGYYFPHNTDNDWEFTRPQA